MRFSLWQGSREILVFDRMRLVRFDSIEEAAEFLLQYARQPENLQALRNALAADPQYAFAANGDEATVIVRAADLLVAGRLQMIDDPNGMMPWSWVFPATPSMPVEYKSAEAEPTEALSDETETEEKESEEEDVKPEPVIPPEYPALAKREGDAIRETTDHYNFKLDLLRYVGLGAIPEAEVPEVAKSAAYSMANHVVDSSKGIAGTLLPLANLEDILPSESEVALEARAVASSMNLPLNKAALQFSEQLLSLSNTDDVSLPETEVGAETRDVAASMGEPFKRIAGGFADQLRALSDKSDLLIPDSEVATAAVEMAAAVGRPLTKLAEGMAEELRKMLGLSGEPQASEVSAMFQMISEDQSSSFVESAKGFAASLAAKLLGTSDDEAAQKEKEVKTLQFSLQDVNSQPLRGERFCVEFPDGHKEYGALDRDGSATLNDVGDEGPFMLSFPGVTSPWKLASGPDPEMTIHTVASGDYLSKIAKNYNLDSWVQLYEHPANASFRALRPNPNQILPGDQIFIPGQNEMVCEVQAGKDNRCRIINPLKSSGGVDDRVVITYTFQKGNEIGAIGAAHEGVDWRSDIYEHPRNAALRKKRTNPYSLKPGDVLFIPVPDEPFIRYVVQDGDSLSKIAAAYGKNWEEDIYLNEKNADFKASHPNPNLIQPGDVIYIPRG